MCAVAQDLAQLESRWGHTRAQTIFSNLPTKVVLPGVANSHDLDALACLGGHRFVRQVSEGASEGGGGRSRSTQRSWTREPVVTGPAIFGLPRWHAYVLGLGPHPVVVRFAPGYRTTTAALRRLRRTQRVPLGWETAEPIRHLPVPEPAGVVTPLRPRPRAVPPHLPLPGLCPGQRHRASCSCEHRRPAARRRGPHARPPHRVASDDTAAGDAPSPADDAGAELPEQDAVEIVAGRRHRDVMARLGQVDTRVDELAADVARVAGLHTELAVVVSEDLGPRLNGLWQVCREEIGQLRTAVAELLAEQDKQKNPPVDWIAMTEEQAAKQWPVLARWIGERLVPWYELTRADLPDCWALHRPVVVELSWLRSAHVQSYLDHTHPHITAEWHARWRPFVVARINEAIDSKCRPGEHQPIHGPTMSSPPAAATATTPGGVAQRAQLALPQHWWPFYQQAYYHDLAFRRERTARGELNWTPAPPPPSGS